MFGPLGATLAPYVQSSRTLTRWITPVAHWYANASGWRKYGYKYDDLCTSLRVEPFSGLVAYLSLS